MGQSASTDKSWLKATYTTHVFHYRLPQTAAIAAVNPSLPSPLTVKMAIIASLLRSGDISTAKTMASELPHMKVLIRHADASLVFKAFLRYRSHPAVPDKGSPKPGIDETGSLYPSRPHMREYAILSSAIDVYVEVSNSLRESCKKALFQIPYLGCKDSLVTCIGVNDVAEPSNLEVANPLSIAPLRSGIIWYLSDFKSDAEVDLMVLIPTQRQEKHYTRTPYLVPYDSRHWGRTTLYFRR